MKRSTPPVARRRSSEPVKGRSLNLAYEDATGIDGDIETLLNRIQLTEGCTRDKANAELVRSLLFAASAVPVAS